MGVKLFERTHRGLHLTKAGISLYQDAKYIIGYCKDSVTRAKNAMQEDESVIRIGTSPMTPAQILVELWPKIHEHSPHIKFQLIPFDNTPENAREILANLGQNIDVVAGIFDETMLDLNVDTFNRCENSNDILMATKAWTNVHPLLKIIPVEWEHSIPYGLLHSREPSKTVQNFLTAVQTVLN